MGRVSGRVFRVGGGSGWGMSRRGEGLRVGLG